MREQEAEPPLKKLRETPLEEVDGKELGDRGNGSAGAVETMRGEGGPVEGDEASGERISEEGVDYGRSVGVQEGRAHPMSSAEAPLGERPAEDAIGARKEESPCRAIGSGDVDHAHEKKGRCATDDSIEPAETLEVEGIEKNSAQDGKELTARRRSRASETESLCGSKAATGFLRKTPSGKKRAQKGTGRGQESETRTQLKLSNFFAKRKS